MRKLIALAALALGASQALPAAAQLPFTALSPPCRVLDPRKPAGPTAQTAGRPLPANGNYTFNVQGNAGDNGNGGACAMAVPAGAVAVFLNATAVVPAG